MPDSFVGFCSTMGFISAFFSLLHFMYLILFMFHTVFIFRFTLKKSNYIYNIFRIISFLDYVTCFCYNIFNWYYDIFLFL